MVYISITCGNHVTDGGQVKLRFNSMRLKLQFIVLITTFAALTISLLGNLAGDIWELRRNSIAAADSEARQLGRLVTPALRAGRPELAHDYLRAFLPGVHAVAVYDAQGGLFASYQKPGHEAALPQSPQPSGASIDQHELALAQAIGDGGRQLGVVYLRVKFDPTNTIVEDIEIAVVVSLLALTIAMLMIARLEQRVTQPIMAAAGTARRVVEQRDYSSRAVRASDDEVGVLVDALNQMLDVIEQRNGELEASSASLEQRVRERTAELLEAKASAEQANHAKSAFLSSMSHELRTPLNAILGFAQLLESEGQPPEHRKEFTSYILKSGRHLLTLINEILDLAQVESGATTVTLEAVDLADLLRECETMMAPSAAQRGVTLRFPQGPAPAVLADRTRLKQVLLNLLSNAIKYNRPDGSVSVACRAAAGQRVLIEVQDGGVGLDAAQMQLLFQPFNRLGQESGGEEVTGIGLVVTKRLVELMDGSIGASSVPGQGSTFWIELGGVDPALGLAVSAAGAAAEASPALLAERRTTLLYIEDNAANMRLMEEILRFSPSLRMIAAGDAILGIQLARSELPDLILMDIQLPGMNGYDALAILQADPLTAPIPVIAVTAGAMPGDLEAARAAGFFRYLTKPLELAELIAALNDALASRAAPAQPLTMPEPI